MTTDPEPSALYLQLAPQGDLTPDELDQMARQLRHEISELEVDSVEPVKAAGT